MYKLNNKIVLSTSDSIRLVEIKDIIYCKSDNVYTTFHLTNNETITISVSIKMVEQQLNNKIFIRPHQSYLVNTNHIKSIDKIADGGLLLSNDTRIPSSSRKRKVLMQLLDKYTRIQTQT